MDIQALIEAAREGRFEPAHVIVGTETFLVERAIAALRSASVGKGISGFNDDVFHGAAGFSARAVLGVAKTVPMMSPARFILVRHAESIPAAELDVLASYLETPCDSTCLVLTAEKLDGRMKLMKVAKQKSCLAEATPLRAGDVRSFAVREAKSRGHRLDPGAAEALAEAIGTDLAALDDALERLSLFVGAGQPIGAEAVADCVSRLRVDSIWALVDSISVQDKRRALAAAESLLQDREPPLRILAMVARQLRMIARMREALASGLRGPEAVKAASAPPFKARELTEAARRFSMPKLAQAFQVLADADFALKGGKVPGEVVIEEAILGLCR